MLSFDEKFFEEEIRWEYKISPMRKRNWASQMEVLCRVDAICKENNIEYVVSWGTLLGAVRHKGFIPWDDDIDISMRREEYERFLKVLPKYCLEFNEAKEISDEEIGDRLLYVEPWSSSGWNQPFARIVNSTRIRFDDDYLSRYHGNPFVQGIDVFPFDYMPEDSEDLQVIYDVLGILNTYAFIKDFWDDKGCPAYDCVKDTIEKVEDMCDIHIDRTKNVQNQICRLFDRYSKLFNYDESKYMMAMPWYVREDGRKIRCEKEWFDEIIYLPFENTFVPAPKEYDRILTAFYGDYITPPSIKESEHDFEKNQFDSLFGKVDTGNMSPEEFLEKVAKKYK